MGYQRRAACKLAQEPDAVQYGSDLPSIALISGLLVLLLVASGRPELLSVHYTKIHCDIAWCCITGAVRTQRAILRQVLAFKLADLQLPVSAMHLVLIRSWHALLWERMNRCIDLT